jgi:glycosyltransferase involved in cell wall biosynthesis
VNALTPKVSIVTPLYNSSPYIAETLASVRAQTFEDWEHILIDDGSTDDTPQKVEPYLGDARLTYARQENLGIAGARNAGIRAARGEWVCLLDHDDRWIPEKLKRQLSFAAEYGLDIVSTDAVVVEGDARSLYSKFFPESLVAALRRSLDDAVVDVFALLIEGDFLCASSVMARKSLFDRLGLLDEHAAPADDYEMWLRCARAGARVGHLDAPLIEYRLHAHNFSRNQLVMAEGEIYALKKTRARVAASGDAHCQVLDRRISELSRKTARAYLDEYHRAAQVGRLSEAIPFFRQALRLAPSEVLRPRRLVAALMRGASAAAPRARRRGA